MKCTRKWVEWMSGLIGAGLTLTALCGLALSLVCELASIQAIPWAEGCLAGCIVGIYCVSVLCVVAYSVQETVRWFVEMVGEMQGGKSES